MCFISSNFLSCIVLYIYIQVELLITRANGELSWRQVLRPVADVLVGVEVEFDVWSCSWTVEPVRLMREAPDEFRAVGCVGIIIVVFVIAEM